MQMRRPQTWLQRLSILFSLWASVGEANSTTFPPAVEQATASVFQAIFVATWTQDYLTAHIQNLVTEGYFRKDGKSPHIENIVRHQLRECLASASVNCSLPHKINVASAFLAGDQEGKILWTSAHQFLPSGAPVKADIFLVRIGRGSGRPDERATLRVKAQLVSDAPAVVDQVPISGLTFPAWGSGDFVRYQLPVSAGQPIPIGMAPSSAGLAVYSLGVATTSGEMVISVGRTNSPNETLVFTNGQKIVGPHNIVTAALWLKPGMSGGPLIDQNGNVLAINSGSDVSDASVGPSGPLSLAVRPTDW